MIFEEANKLALKLKEDIYQNDAKLNRQVYDAFVEIKNEQTCYKCAHRGVCYFRGSDTDMIKCRYFIERTNC